jgi:capsular polysaccharide export protein
MGHEEAGFREIADLLPAAVGASVAAEVSRFLPEFPVADAGTSRSRTFLAFGSQLSLSPAALRGPGRHGPRGWVSSVPASGGLSLPEAVLATGEHLSAERGLALATKMVARGLGGDCHLDPARSRGRAAALVLLGADTAINLKAIEGALERFGASRTTVVLAPGMRGPTGVAAGAERVGCTVLVRPFEPWGVIATAEEVHDAGGGDEAFLALLGGVKVHCYVPTAISGWGLTSDLCGHPRVVVAPTIGELATAFLIEGARYADTRGQVISAEDALQVVEDRRREERANRRVAAVAGMPGWKRARVREMLSADGHVPAFHRSASAAVEAALAKGGAVAFWASKPPRGLVPRAAEAGVPLARVEDGFIRSVGLGVECTPPASLTVDFGAAHYDCSGESDLVRLLKDTDFDRNVVARARALVELLVERGATKYSVGTEAVRLAAPAGRRRVLVPGQVGDDASVLLGGDGVFPGLDLLRRVRADAPDAWIAYRPHPDVDSGLRPGAVPDDEVLGVADEIVRGGSMAGLFGCVDEVHVLTSLAGFEALLRGLPVTVHGRPFFAGWGLTRDKNPSAGRGRSLTMDELAAGALLLYPRHVDPANGLPCGPETVVRGMSDPSRWRPGFLVRARRAQGAVTRLLSALHLELTA